MSKLENIYQFAFVETPAGDQLNREQTKRIEEDLDRMNFQTEEEREKVAYLVYDANSQGRQHGFFQGFKFAASLMLEVFV